VDRGSDGEGFRTNGEISGNRACGEQIGSKDESQGTSTYTMTANLEDNDQGLISDQTNENPSLFIYPYIRFSQSHRVLTHRLSSAEASPEPRTPSM
jgi:hypothetical protein